MRHRRRKTHQLNTKSNYDADFSLPIEELPTAFGNFPSGKSGGDISIRYSSNGRASTRSLFNDFAFGEGEATKCVVMPR